ncbi:MAG: PKD domain-containing protein [Patescibacteria group bacterium]|nr:PKD domain-containing protein [Patescibacteria group bacterium]
MSLGFVSAGEFPASVSIQFVNPTPSDGDLFPEALDPVSIEVNVTVTSDGGNLDNIVVYLYDDSGLVDSAMGSSSPFSHTFSSLSRKNYHINATANDTAGINTKSTATRTISVNEPPDIVFSISPVSAIGVAPFEVSFNAAFTTDPEGDTSLTYRWDFDDGTVDDSTGAEVTHIYSTNDTYTVNLIVTDTGGMSDSRTKIVIVRPSCGVLGADETCIAVPENMCSPNFNQGLECGDLAAERYCKILGYNSYVTGSKNCDDGGHGGGGRALSENLGDCGAGITTWILSMKCSGTATPGECTVGAEGSDPFVQGDATKGGVTWPDVCIDNIKLNETTCDSSDNLDSAEVPCAIGCSGGVCVAPTGGLVCNPDTSKKLSNTIPQTKRDRNDDDDIYYCGLNLEWKVAEELGEDCTADYECISNSCVEGECYGVRTELEEQRNILINIWCFLTNMKDYLDNRADIQTAAGNIGSIKVVAPDYGACLENPFG